MTLNAILRDSFKNIATYNNTNVIITLSIAG